MDIIYQCQPIQLLHITVYTNLFKYLDIIVILWNFIKIYRCMIYFMLDVLQTNLTDTFKVYKLIRYILAWFEILMDNFRLQVYYYHYYYYY